MALDERYLRNCTALSPEECAMLAHKRVLVVGCGGLGGNVIEQLARTGVGFLRVVDGDVFAVHNLNRQILCTEDLIGKSKAEAAKRRVQQVNSDVEVESCVCFLDEGNAGSLVEGIDCAVDALDSPKARKVLRDACRKGHVPLVHGAIAGWFGQVGVTLPEDEEDVFADVPAGGQGGGKGVEQTLGNLAPTAAAIASIEAAEALKLLIGRESGLHGKMLMVDLEVGSFDTIVIS